MCHAAKNAPYVTRPRTAYHRPAVVPPGGAEIIVLHPPESKSAPAASPAPRRPQGADHWTLGHLLPRIVLASLLAALIGGSLA